MSSGTGYSTQKETDSTPPRDAQGMRTDGPTFEEFVAAGYKSKDYPPQGYAEKPSEGLTQFRQAQASTQTATSSTSATVPPPAPTPGAEQAPPVQPEPTSEPTPVTDPVIDEVASEEKAEDDGSSARHGSSRKKK